MPKAPKLNNDAWVKAYFRAKDQGLTLKQFAEEINQAYGAVWSRKRNIEKKMGNKLPAMKADTSRAKSFIVRKKGGRPVGAQPKTAISAEAFIRIWQLAENMEEVLEKTGLSHEIARGKAGKLRAAGVKSLKKFDARGTKLDIKALIALADSLAPKKDQHPQEENLAQEN